MFSFECEHTQNSQVFVEPQLTVRTLSTKLENIKGHKILLGCLDYSNNCNTCGSGSLCYIHLSGMLSLCFSYCPDVFCGGKALTFSFVAPQFCVWSH